MKVLSKKVKRDGSTLDYQINWEEWLAPSESIASATWSMTGPDAALVVEVAAPYAPSFDSTFATVWLSGGTIGARYIVTCTITTTSTPPRIDERSIMVTISEV